tara:strand:+ start:759 stop:1079 length:321 start_codon:yes stop_codon:yes gene_type:complete
MKGYVIIKGITNRHKTKDLKGRKYRGIVPIRRLIIKNKIISFFLVFPEAMSLLLVLLTFTSNFLSLKSFQIHPAALIPAAPKKNIIERKKTSDIFILFRVIPHMQG